MKTIFYHQIIKNIFCSLSMHLIGGCIDSEIRKTNESRRDVTRGHER